MGILAPDLTHLGPIQGRALSLTGDERLENVKQLSDVLELDSGPAVLPKVLLIPSLIFLHL